MRKKIILSLLGFGILIGALTGCGSSTATEDGVETVKVGTMGTYEPFSFQDEAGNLTGYDIEVLREVEKRVDGVKFEFIASPWDSLFIGLDADKFQVLANQITSNEEREARYLLTDNSYFADITQPIVRGDDDSIKSIADLKGKKVGTTVGDSHTRALEEYNKANGNEIIIEYYDADINSVLQDLVNGRIDATVNNPIMAKKKADVLGLNIKFISESLVEDPALFIVKKDEKGKALKEKIDTALLAIKEDGTLSKLSIEWFGEDYTK